jgi:hypothetical protein
VTAANAARIAGWLKERGGIALWRSINLSNPSGSWTGPVRDKDGNVNEKPNWQCASTPERIITDPNEVAVITPKEVRRFRVAVRHGSSNWMQLKLTDASTRKVNAAKERAGEGSWHEFDFSTQEAIIYTAGRAVPLPEYLAQNLEVAS